VSAPGFGQRSQAGDKICQVAVIPEDGRLFDPPHHHVVEGVERMQAGLSEKRSNWVALCHRAPRDGGTQMCVDRDSG
jgi:hypothetical protein